MPTYEYKCRVCGHRFEQRQAISAAPLTECPKCDGQIYRVVSGGSGMIIKSGSRGREGRREEGCRLEQEGRTCCGREERCGRPVC